MTDEKSPDPGAQARRRRRRRRRRPAAGPPTDAPVVDGAEGGSPSDTAAPAEAGEDGRPRRRRRRSGGGASGDAAPAAKDRGAPDRGADRGESVALSGVLELRKDGTGFLRDPARNLEDRKGDPMVPKELVRKFQLKEGSEVAGQGFPGQPAPRMRFVETVDGMRVEDHRRRRNFRKLTVIDPDFHYELGTHAQEGQISMRILDVLAPLGRGQRALLVAPPRSGKTMLMQQVARAMEALYPDVHLIVLLIDERPEEATYWKRELERGEVYVSTMDETPKNHVRLAELVQARAERLVESGREVMILLDSITRLARAYNHVSGNSGKTMSGGLDARTMARPKTFFGAARNTEDAGSLTILGTTLVDTGSKMDQVIFEEFKGTGNMELVLDRRLADRRVFPAIAVDRSGTRKEEKILMRTTMRRINILRRVLSRMRPLEAMELMVNRLAQYPSNREFLDAFSMEDVD